jgi:hypothetical protein
VGRGFDAIAARAVGMLAAAMLAPAAALAQDDTAATDAVAPDTVTPVSETTDGVQVFEPAFFAVYNPLTAFDMVRQVPGFTIDEGEQLRGFGATAGNVLINGCLASSWSGAGRAISTCVDGRSSSTWCSRKAPTPGPSRRTTLPRPSTWAAASA